MQKLRHRGWDRAFWMLDLVPEIQSTVTIRDTKKQQSHILYKDRELNAKKSSIIVRTKEGCDALMKKRHRKI